VTPQCLGDYSVRGLYAAAACHFLSDFRPEWSGSQCSLDYLRQWCLHLWLKQCQPRRGRGCSQKIKSCHFTAFEDYVHSLIIFTGRGEAAFCGLAVHPEGAVSSSVIGCTA
jgi:hypothetical protein